MKRKFVRGMIACAAVFPLLFTLRLVWGYATGGRGDDGPAMGLLGNAGVDQTGESLFGSTRKNYATSKYGRSESAPSQVDQKYEKVATLRAETQRFTDDENKLRASIKKHDAMIQFEQAHGLAGQRQLRLSIGVPPSEFDPMLADARGIGATVEVQVDKTDKTNEYKDLAAQRTSLGTARAALTALKGRGGSIQEQIELENKILDVEEQIQKLGVRLGEFDAENEFVTIHFTLVEKQPIAARSISLAHRVHVAATWSAYAYAALLGLAFLASLVVLLFIGLLERLRVLPEALRRAP